MMPTNRGSELMDCQKAILLALPLLAVTVAAGADRLYLYREAFIEVGSPDTATLEQCKTTAKKVIAAWNFDAAIMHWANASGMKRPLLVRLLSDERMARDHPGLRAAALKNGDKFVVKMGLLGDPTLDLTIAHEIGHVQAFRTLGSYAEMNVVPTYFLEGHGLMMNQLYADHLGVNRHEGGGKQVRDLMSITAAEAQAVLTDDRYFRVGMPAEKQTKNYHMECMGMFFIEYLRVNKRISDAVPRMARVFESVARGESYGQAFAESYGVPLDQAIAEVVAFMKRTETHRADRFKGMRFEEYLPENAKKSTEKE
jgi:hypothetical protein